MNANKLLYIIFLISFGYFFVQAFYYLLMCFIGALQERKRMLQFKDEDLSLISTSHFTLPVSIIIPAHNEERHIANSIKSVLYLNYPEYEVIVVDDGSTDKTPDILNDILSLEPLNKTYTEKFTCGPIKKIYRSKKYPNITVINKEGGCKKAGALNAGLNFARYKYICVVDADTIIFEPDSLLKVMSQVAKDPERIVGAGSYFGLVNGFKIEDGKIIERSFSYNPLIAYQNLEYIRSFMSSRLSWSAFNAMPCVAGGFGLWRRDLIMQLGGFETEFSSEDLEITFRAHDYMVKNKKDYRILMFPYYVAWTNGPQNISSLVLQRNRWQRVLYETIWRYKYMFFNWRYKWMAFFTLPYFLFYEFLGVFFELGSILVLTWALASKLLDLKTYLVYFVFMLLIQAFISLSVLFVFVRDQKVFKLRYTIYLIFLSFFEVLLYRPIIIAAKILGTLDYSRGIRLHDQFKR